MKHDKAQSHNEQVKHYAAMLAAIGIAILIAGVITPMFDSEQPFYFISIPLGFGIWSVSAYVISKMVKEEN